METDPMRCFYLLLLMVICDGFHVHGPSGPLIVQLGGSVILPCFVETPLPMQELEIEWKRNDSETLVHLWQDKESHPESQNPSYHERAHFFIEEIAQGNFSLFLTNVTREDAGVYKCAVYTNHDSYETLIEIKEIEHLIVSGAHVISAYVGEDITLNCSVDSHIPAENIEEVSWRKMDGEILVLLYEHGEVQTDSSHERYMDRVELFSAEERNKGNFSLRLKDVRTDDKGLYTCSAFSGEFSDNTAVEVQQLSISSMHVGIFVLSVLGFVIGSLILGYLSYTSFKNNDDSRRALAIQWGHVLCPNITMAIVFILWGVTEGFFSEAATCSALNSVRIVFLLWIALHLKTFEGYPHQLINHLAIPLQYAVISVNAYSLFFWISFMILEVLSASGSIYVHYAVVDNVKERDALTCAIAFLHILTVITLFTSRKYLSDQESDSSNTGTQQSLYHLVVFMFGSVVVVLVNAVALLVELILKAQTGQRTVDLRVILLPTESVFAVCCLILQISDFWKKNREGFGKNIDWMGRTCGCKQEQRDSPPQCDERELENLAPEAQTSGS
ncbi:uncharacterized protein LOC128617183 isoform X2 [Ictalurus furcatus]|uniref:uncharacterized protein LOC128617183 isoform X2 n=1 Tax=Ictalurus furcatus TaxID=66913 RepID=UPI00234FFD5A|nr:uncharacterized protein LOC128617183 isoform X2 [Ictalurus furcatus]